MFTSKLRLYSYGKVAENKPMSSKIAKITPVEVIPFLDGEITANPTPLEDSGVDASGQNYAVRVLTDITIDAEWLNLSTNRVTPPDLRRGEEVLIWQYADVDKFYWTPTGRTDYLRKLETVIFAISATKDEEDTKLTPENTYSLEFSSHTKQITLRTSKANGEPHTYTFQFNTGTGAVTLQDDIGNLIELDSIENKLTFQNANSTRIVLYKKRIDAYAKDFVKFVVHGPCHIDSPECHFGEPGDLEPSVLGDKMAAAMERLIRMMNESQVIGNLGVPTSPIQAVRPIVEPELESGGNVYSKKNKNQ